MAEQIKNIMKKAGIFSCCHPAHARFHYHVSPYHVLKINKCWPDGCVEFLWRCHLFDKGHKCPRKYKHVGRGCFSCKDYYEIKNQYTPSSRLDPAAFANFMRDLGEYEGWIEDLNDKTIRFSGIVESIRPHLIMIIDSRRKSLRMEEYFVSFPGGFIGRDFFADRLYMRISGGFLNKTELAPGDEIECDAIFGGDRGRVILRNPRRIELAGNGGRQALNPSRALVGRATGKIIEGSIERCGDCHYCTLVDIEDFRKQKTISYRRFYCLRGITDPEHCPVRLRLLPDDDQVKNTARRL